MTHDEALSELAAMDADEIMGTTTPSELHRKALEAARAREEALRSAVLIYTAGRAALAGKE